MLLYFSFFRFSCYCHFDIIDYFLRRFRLSPAIFIIAGAACFRLSLLADADISHFAISAPDADAIR